MQNRYAGDIGDYIKLALLREIAPAGKLGIAWYLHPDEDHNGDGMHVSYLEDPSRWRCLDSELFDKLGAIARRGRSVAALEASGILPGAHFASEPLPTRDARAKDRPGLRDAWFVRVLERLSDSSIVFADPDNGLVDDDPRRRRHRVFGKQLPLLEAKALAEGRTAVIYHHNTRFSGGHDREVAHWRHLLGPGTLAVRANAWTCRTFFIINPTLGVREAAISFCERWAGNRVWLDSQEAGIDCPANR